MKGIVIAAAVTVAAVALAGCVTTGQSVDNQSLYKACTDATRITFPSCSSGAGGG